MNFQHSPNDNIRINSDELNYFDTLTNFFLDWTGDYSGLPEGYREAQVEGERKSIYTENSQVDMPEDFYAEILVILDNLATIIANKTVREAEMA